MTPQPKQPSKRRAPRAADVRRALKRMESLEMLRQAERTVFGHNRGDAEADESYRVRACDIRECIRFVKEECRL